MTRSGRNRKCGRTIHCGVFSERKTEPKKAERDKGEFICPICGSNFTRAAGVNYHFASCVEKHGNPDRCSWDDHPSCQPKTTSKYRLVVHPSPDGESSASGKRVAKKDSLAPSSSSASQPSAGPRVNRPRQQYPGDFPSGPSAAQTQPRAQPAASSSEPRVTRSRATQRTVTRPEPSTTAPHSASKRSTAQRKPKQAKSTEAKPTKTTSKKTKQQPRTEADAGTAYRCHLNESLPPLSDLPAIFDDLVSRALEKTSLAEAMKVLPQKRINVATMCSGTESPLLALNMIQNSKH